MKASKFNKLLGDLEADIMEVIWSQDNCTVREVLDKIKKKRKVAYTTIMTVMARLREKGFLNRKLDDSGAYLYSFTKSKQDFLKSASRDAIEKLIKEFGEIAVAQFIDTVESGNISNLENWRKKLKNIK